MRSALVLCALILLSTAGAAAQDQAPPRPRGSERTVVVRAVRSDFRALQRIGLRRLERDADMDKYQDWIRRYFQPWLERRTAAMATLQSTGQRATHPFDHAIAAAHVAAGYADFIHRLTRIRTPPTMRLDPELLAIYQSAIDGVTEPLRQRAVSAYQVCERDASVVGATATRWEQYCRESREALTPASAP